jgi:Ca2+-transporting ATPase
MAGVPGTHAGLTQAEAMRRLVRDGPNLLPAAAPSTAWRLLAGILSEPMLLLLLGAGGVYMLLGDRVEAAAMTAFVGVIILISFLQERRTRRALESLRDLSAPRARVLRDGEAVRIPGAEVVEGDLLLLSEGDRVAADARITTGVLQVDESLLTGESGVVSKLPGPGPEGPGEAEGGRVHAGTLVAKGVAQAVVFATGFRTRMGGIGRSLAETRTLPSPLQVAARRLVRAWATAALALAAGAVLLSWFWAGRPLLPSLLLGVALDRKSVV